jgi:hypothetical protein
VVVAGSNKPHLGMLLERPVFLEHPVFLQHPVFLTDVKKN